jgi:FkbM family methyltransferase
VPEARADAQAQTGWIAADTARGRIEAEVALRPGTSDAAALQQVFGRQDYDLRRLRRAGELDALYERLVAGGRVPLILDLGANVGLASVYFAKVWPGSHVVALEPAADNFGLLFQNTQDLANVTAWCAGVASGPGRLRLANPDAEKWAYRTAPAEPAAEGTVPGVSVPEILAEFSADRGYDPFIAKIDVEGAEAELFGRNTGWVERFPLLIIELHDWLLCGEASSRSFLRVIAELDRDFVLVGENVFSIANHR